MKIFVTLLNINELKVYAALVEAYRSACFHAACGYAVFFYRLGESFGCRLGYAASLELYFTHVHHAVEERAGCNYYAGRECSRVSRASIG